MSGYWSKYEYARSNSIATTTLEVRRLWLAKRPMSSTAKMGGLVEGFRAVPPLYLANLESYAYLLPSM
jgi:hypothetical protein